MKNMLIMVLLGITTLIAQAAAAPIHPDFTRATMQAGTNDFRPQRVVAVSGHASLIDGLALTAHDGGLSALRLSDGKAVWAAQTPGGMYPEVVEHRAGIAFIRAWGIQDRNGYKQYTPDPSLEVRRLRLDDGHWLSPLSVGTPLLKRDLQIVSVVAASNGVFVLDCTQGESDLHERQIKSYRISGFLGDATKPSWQKEFKSAGTVPSYGAGLLSQGDRLYAKSTVHQLSVIGDTLIACAGGVEDILALDSVSGAEKWCLPAVWEFRRGFIGPSVWQHFIARFGVDHLPDDKDIRDEEYGKEVKATRNRMAEMRKDLAGRCRIVGGPVVVPTPTALQSAYRFCSNCGKYHGKPPSEQYRMFVAVSEGEGSFAGYLSECMIYEITDEGKPIALVRMPRMVMGSQSFIRDGVVIWQCEHGAFAEMRPSAQSSGIGMGGHGTDCIANLSRFIQPCDTSGVEDEGNRGTTNWLAWANANDPACLLGDTYCRLSGEPYIRVKGEPSVRFPLAAIPLNGMPLELTLVIPFTGEPRLPSSNYSSSGSSTRSFCPLYMNVIDLEKHDGELAITVSVQDGETAILFFQESQIRRRAGIGNQ